MAYDIESSLGCSHCVCVCVFCVLNWLYAFICACFGTIHLSDDPPAAVRPCVEGLFTPPSGWGQEFSAVLSNDLQSTSITHPWDAWLLPSSPGRGELIMPSWLCHSDFLVTAALSNKQTFTVGTVNSISISRSVEQHATINVEPIS